MMSRLAGVRILNEFRRCKHDSRTWKRLDNVTQNYRFRKAPEAHPSEQKAEFQKKLKQFLQEIEHKKEIQLSPRQNFLPENTEQDPLVKLLLNGSKKLRDHHLDPKSKDVIGDETLLRHFIKQYALSVELSSRYGLPKCGFDSYSVDQIRNFLQNNSDFVTLLRKAARKFKDKEKKLKNVKEVEERLRDDMIPYYNLDKAYKDLTRWRLEVNPIEENPLIIDMDYDQLMAKRAMGDLSLQLQYMMNHNMKQPDPLRFLFVNFTEHSEVYQKLKRCKVQGFPDGYHSVTDRNLLELDIKTENLVYLTPDAMNDMETYNESKAYIIGGLVDIGSAQGKKTTSKIAKQIGIAQVKFPLHKYLIWGNRTGRNEFSLDIVHKIFHTFRTTRNWPKAFVHIPKRFHRGLNELGIEEANGDNELLEWYSSITPYYDQSLKPSTKSNTADYLGWS